MRNDEFRRNAVEPRKVNVTAIASTAFVLLVILLGLLGAYLSTGKSPVAPTEPRALKQTTSAALEG